MESKRPDKPKAAVRAFYFYEQHNRKRIRDENEHLCGFEEVRKKCAEEWKALDGMGRREYVTLQEEDNKRYVKEMEAYKTVRMEAKMCSIETIPLPYPWLNWNPNLLS